MKKMISVFLILFQLTLWSNESLETKPAYWNGNGFQEHGISYAQWISQVIEDPTIYFEPYAFACYGHALLDGVLPLYVMLKKFNLLNSPINLAIKLTSHEVSNPTVRNMLQLIRDVFHFKNIIVLNADEMHKKFYFKSLISLDFQKNYSSYYRSFPESFNYITALKSFGIQDNVVFQDANTSENITKEFVHFITSAYGIKTSMIKNRVLMPDRRFARKIVNLNELVQNLRANGYDVVVLDFESIPIKEQIIHTMQAEYLMGTYGSNLVNAMFLHPEANVVVLWHKYSKYFWSRKYCIIHSAFLSKGVKLIEFDQTDYDSRNVYTESVHVPEYFYRQDNKNYLRPEKSSLDEIVKYPLPAQYEITNVDLYIQPNQIVELLDKAKYLHNEPCQIGR